MNPRSTRKLAAFMALCSMALAASTVLLLSTQSTAEAAAGSRGAYAWGNNATGELADGTTIGRSAPVQSIGLAHVSSVAVGMWHGLALRTDGTVVAWGHNPSGALGDGTTVDRLSPVKVVGLSNVHMVSAGTAFSLAALDDGAVFAWGNNTSGELGNGKAPTDSSKPVAVRGLGAGSGVIAVAAGGSFGLALESNGEVLSWGNNASGELGDGTAPNDHPTPVHVRGLGAGSGVIAIAAGGAHALALKADGEVMAWGNNASGELGDGHAPNNQSRPVPVRGLGAGSGVMAIAAGGSFSLALGSNGEVRSWGNNASGELGDGKAPTDSSVPVRVKGISDAIAVAGGRAHALALTGRGSVLAWGDNTLGQIGDGSGSPAITPVTIDGFRAPVLGVFAGGDHSHVLVRSTKPKPSGGSGHGGGDGTSPTPDATSGTLPSSTPKGAHAFPSSGPTAQPTTTSAAGVPTSAGGPSATTSTQGHRSAGAIAIALTLVAGSGAGTFLVRRRGSVRPVVKGSRRAAENASRRGADEMWRG